MNSNSIKITETDNYLQISLNEPETLNAFSKEMIVDICDQIDNLKTEKRFLPLIITGEGRAFSSGGNLELMNQYVEKNKSVEYLQQIVPFVNELILRLLNYPGPTLAIINGPAVGGGFNLAMACDFRIIHEKAKCRMGFIDIGLTPATGNSFFLPKLLGIPRTIDLILFSETMTPFMLHEWGLVNEIYTLKNFEEIKQKWIEKLVILDPFQVKTVRELVYASFTNNIGEHLNFEYSKILESGNRQFFKEKVLERWGKIQFKNQS
jgi:2-(1,2-epoxy-1,2-dihydrophenyl)acetyl-CoA isomerase